MSKPALRVMAAAYTVCKAPDLTEVALDTPLVFIARTQEELSIVCETARAPANATDREDGWRAMMVEGPLVFEMVGVLAGISSALAEGGVSLFAVSTYDTDYILVKAEDLERAVGLLEVAGYTVRA